MEPIDTLTPKRHQCNSSTAELSIIVVKNSKLLELGVIKPSSPDSGQVISPIFTKPKKDGSHRVIFNLKYLNQSVMYYHFKMDTLETAISLVSSVFYDFD